MDPVLASVSFLHLVISYLTLPSLNILSLVSLGSSSTGQHHYIPMPSLGSKTIGLARDSGCLKVIPRCLVSGSNACSHILDRWLPAHYLVPQLQLVWTVEIIHYVTRGHNTSSCIHSLQSASAPFEVHWQVNLNFVLILQSSLLKSQQCSYSLWVPHCAVSTQDPCW